jgi:uncharacterized protein YbaP (TraB family)
LDCAVFATEFNLDDGNEYSIQDAMQLPKNVSWEMLFSKKWREKISKLVKKQTQLDLTFFYQLKPIALTNLLSENCLSGSRLMALDQALWEFARENGCQLRGIETFEEQIAILKKMSLDEQVKTLKEISRNFSKFRRHLIYLTKLYEKGDIQQLYKASKKSLKGAKWMMLYERNDIMATRILDIIKNDTACIAIGAGHLAGQQGVLRLLKLRGVKVKALR